MAELAPPFSLALQLGLMEGRLSALEHKMELLEERIERRLATIEQKIDQLTAALNLGRGGWKALAIVSTLMASALDATAWLFDHLPWKGP
jgi:hypothetical protein